MEDSRHLDALRGLMRKYKIDLYIVFLADEHASEYVVDAYQRTRWLSGFTGTNATIVVTEDDAGLWTDGRYFIQAKRQIADSGVRLFPMGEDGVPTVEEYVKDNLPIKGRMACNGKVITLSDYDKYLDIADSKRARFTLDRDLIGMLWKDAPALPEKKVWILEDEYAGEPAAEKISRVLYEVSKEGAEGLMLTGLCDIAWLLNIRGDDIRHTPVPMAFLFLSEKKKVLFIAKKALEHKTRKYFRSLGIKVKPYESVYSFASKLRCPSVMLDPSVINARLALSFRDRTDLICADNPTALMKAVKNETEIKNTRLAHIRDGAAVTKFIYYVKNHVSDGNLTEYSLVQKLPELRAETLHYLDDSFDTIAAYGSNAAMMHYEPDMANDVRVEPKGFLLVDSGGHYLEGTTDITRTIVLGELTPEEIHAYTLTLRGALRLMSAHFPEKTLCQGLDVLARGPFWDEALDYRCGTGHGVGHISSVHEGPNGFRSRITEANPACELKAGMITTDEPGLYVEDGFGVRIENELLCVPDTESEYGRFLCFDNLTMAPIDLEAVDFSMLTEYEKKTLQEYHETVCLTLKPYLTDDEYNWLLNETRER